MSSATTAVLTSPSLEESYRFCRDVAKSRAKNFYYSFLVLEKPQRDAMCAIYAFMRRCDDLSDDPGVSPQEMRRHIATWLYELDSALEGNIDSDHPLWPAFADTVRRYSIPHRFFHEMIEGVSSDLEPVAIATFGDLYRYCYQVASVVGLTIVHIFGFQSPKALLLAEKCGIAFQLTNILRDVREDAALGRVYLPQEDLDRFGVSVEQLHAGHEDSRFRELMRFEAERARQYYADSSSLIDLIAPKSRRSLWAIRAIYLRLLTEIERSNFSVLSRRISVSKARKVGLLFASFLPK